MANDSLQFNTSRRLPIVICLDISPSMGWKIGRNSSSIALLNAALKAFVEELKKDPRVRSAAEVAFVPFSTNIEGETDFVSLSSLVVPEFSAVKEGGTNMAQAVLRSIEKIEKRREMLEDSEIGYYAPFFVLITDGNPDKNDDIIKYNEALEAVKSHCDSHVGASEIIIPFIIGVGDHTDEETLNAYAKGFTSGYFPIKGTEDKAQIKFRKVFELIGNSTRGSVHLDKLNPQEVIRTIRVSMDDLWADLSGD